MSEVEMKPANGAVQTKPAKRKTMIVVAIAVVVLMVGIILLSVPAPISEDVKTMINSAKSVVYQNGDAYMEPYVFAYRPYDDIRELGFSPYPENIWDNAPDSGYLFVILSEYKYLIFFDNNMNLCLSWSSKEYYRLRSSFDDRDLEEYYLHLHLYNDFITIVDSARDEKDGYRLIK